MSHALEYLQYFVALSIVSFWCVIWIMHLCAHTNVNHKTRTKRHSLNNHHQNHNHYPPDHYPGQDQHQHQPHHCLKQQQQLWGPRLNSDHHQQYQPPYMNLPLPSVSIIKPLVGVDANLRQNLDTFFQLEYPVYEILFCVQDFEDPAIVIVNQLIETHPKVDAKLFVGGSRVGVNPKINNMQPAYLAAKYELLLISDSGIFMNRDTLLDMVNHMHHDVALVHQMPFVQRGRRGFQAILEMVYFGTAHARAYLTADLLNINCATGMSALMRKQLLDEVGGIRAFGQYLAEDYFFAKSFTDRGWQIRLSSQPALQNSACSSDDLNNLSTLNIRIQRWIKLRFAMVPQWTLLEPFSECFLLGILASISVNFLTAVINPLALFALHTIVWFILDLKLLTKISQGPLEISLAQFTMAWMFRECTALLIYLNALSNPKVEWRSRVFKLKWGGQAVQLLDKQSLLVSSTTTLAECLSPICEPQPVSSQLNSVATSNDIVATEVTTTTTTTTNSRASMTPNTSNSSSSTSIAQDSCSSDHSSDSGFVGGQVNRVSSDNFV